MKDLKGLFVTTPVAMSVWLVEGSVAVAGLCPEPRSSIPAASPTRIGGCRGRRHLHEVSSAANAQ